jgi:uncharacterized delta-60 repeat protein
LSKLRTAPFGVALLLGFAFGAVSASGSSDHGAVDPTFTDLPGRVLTEVGSDAVLRAVAFTGGSKLVAAGSASNGADDDFAIARYTSAGQLDQTFGSGGITTTPIGPGNDEGEALVVQADKKVVVAGTSSNGSNDDFALVRYSVDGSLDPTFGTGGKVTTPIGSGADRAYALVLQSDGKLVVAGSTFNGSTDDFALVRYNADGSLDTTFGTGGIVVTAIGSGSDRAYGLTVGRDGRLVAVGSSFNGSDDDFAVVRYLSTGALDASFGGTGIVTTANGPARDVAHAVAVRKDGTIFVGGSSSNGSDDDFAVVAYTPLGGLQTTFGVGGKVTTPIRSGDDAIDAIAVQPDGKLLVAGDSAGSTYAFALARYSTNGRLDASFQGGTVKTSIGVGDDHAHALAVLASKNHVTSIVAAGSASDGSTGSFALVRYTSSGAPDPAFTSRPGSVTTHIASGTDRVNAVVAPKSGGGLLAAGASSNGTDDDFALARYTVDGRPMTTFGNGGVVWTDFGSGDDRAQAVLAQPDGKFVLAGSASNGSNDDIALARYNTDGSLDSSFGTGGKVTTDIGGGDDAAYALVRQADGKLVVAGLGYSGGRNDFVLVRYNADGSLDATFGTNGIVTTAIGSAAFARALVVQQNGYLIAAGTASNGTDDDFALVRYDSFGSPDPLWGSGGIVTTPIGPGDDEANALVLQKNGKPIVAGSSFNGSNDDFALVRYNADGSPDPTFGGDGIVTTSFGPGDDDAYGLVLQLNQKPIAVGATWNGADLDFALARYEVDGSPNLPFGTHGEIVQAVGEGNDEIFAAVEYRTYLVVGGLSFNGADTDFALGRYILCANLKGC